MRTRQSSLPDNELVLEQALIGSRTNGAFVAFYPNPGLVRRFPDMHGHIARLTADTPPRAPQWETFGSNKFPIHEPIVHLIKSQLSLR